MAARADPTAVDFLVSTFYGALMSDCPAKCLCPVPGGHVKRDEMTCEDVRQMRKMSVSYPSVFDLGHCSITFHTTPQRTIDVLRELLLNEHGVLRIETIHKLGCDSEFGICCERFRVQPCPQKNTCFETLAKKFGTKIAYHGSSHDNWYSIIRNGLKLSADKCEISNGRAYGDGIYLSSDFCVARAFATVGSGWANSERGGTFSCVAICEYVDHPSISRVKEERSPCGPSPSVPSNYIVVPCDNFIRIKDLVVMRGSGKSCGTSSSGVCFLLVLLLIYCVVLLSSDLRQILTKVLRALQSVLGR
eukprot:CAMPEP_0198731652 /NCGR_PEP_ID=MMETSP1475-20131203/31215_1 /TAXON_ID= ORGANISM="Unidentified sp., Strain CCMP1999" /NCGR_SAMPLE_ID=MMETSP1475 /ASSEMBLY_ACC=CAM_ASM_001111 /LENGTH=303 /DNA_ID=CAMNT_0044494643 /DNA_START=190 /DNA_END=1101 /DNA_ORIENTATION=-